MCLCGDLYLKFNDVDNASFLYYEYVHFSLEIFLYNFNEKVGFSVTVTELKGLVGGFVED